MVQRLIIYFISLIVLSGCNSESECDYFLIDQELKIDKDFYKEVLFCVAYRDFLTDGKPQDMFVLKIDKQNISNYLKDNSLYKEYKEDKFKTSSNPYLLVDDLNNEAGSSKNKKEYREIIDKINPKNSYYYLYEKENYYVESVVDENGYIILSIGR
jgi:hypothetical protein